MLTSMPVSEEVLGHIEQYETGVMTLGELIEVIQGPS